MYGFVERPILSIHSSFNGLDLSQYKAKASFSVDDIIMKYREAISSYCKVKLALSAFLQLSFIVLLDHLTILFSEPFKPDVEAIGAMNYVRRLYKQGAQHGQDPSNVTLFSRKMLP